MEAAPGGRRDLRRARRRLAGRVRQSRPWSSSPATKRSALLGRNLRFLQADDHDQEGLAKIRTALRDGAACQTTLRNYRRDGTMFWNEVTLMPLRDGSGQITHFASFHRDGGDRCARRRRSEPRDPSMSTQTMLAYLRDDKLTGLLRRPYFEELVKRDWGLAQRESRRLSFLVFDLDHYAHYRDVFGKPGRRSVVPPDRARHRRLLPSRQRPVRPLRRRSDRRAHDRSRSRRRPRSLPKRCSRACAISRSIIRARAFRAT